MVCFLAALSHQAELPEGRGGASCVIEVGEFSGKECVLRNRAHLGPSPRLLSVNGRNLAS